ncbi:MAG: hypothetical protein JWQ07_1174 [Ramlibacter sp.]|nr:hypothetical protein [Ramlibacter sp.]
MRHHPPPPRLHAPAGLALLALALLLFGWLAADLLRHGPITRADAGISTWFHGHLHPLITQSLLAVTYLHSTAGVCLMALAAALFLAWRRQAQWLPALALAVPGGLLLNASVKQAFHRARPDLADPLLTLATYSFPSGHTAGATVWWGFFAVLLLSHQPRLAWRVAGVALAAVMISLTALSRVYLGVHYLSDVLAAIAEGCAWLALCFMAVGVMRRPATPSTPIEHHG